VSGAVAPRLKAAVFGVGYLGARHAEKLAAASGFTLTGVHDRDPERARAVAERLGCAAFGSLEEGLDRCEVAVVAASTSAHREIAEAALRAGKPVLVEKPLTGRVPDAEALVALAAETGLVLQVGHVERFNPALRGLIGAIPAPLFVESHRLAPLVPRNLDLDVVQDLMVHDLDLAIAFVGEEPHRVEAKGVAVLTDRVDIANARLSFPGGAVANLTASRVSLERVRKFRMFLPGAYVSADCAQRRGDVYRLKDGREEILHDAFRSGTPLEMLRFLDHQTRGPEGEDPLEAEHAAFRRAVLGEPHEGVSGEQALRTLRAMVAVERAMAGGAGAS
jgi:predicted dehydrogenase